MNTIQSFLDLKFELKKHKTNVKTEFVGALTTFLTTVYILAVNPVILSNCGMDSRAVFWASAISAGLACIGMGLFANLPFVLAPAMGINSYIAYTMCGQMGLTWQNAMACTFISGCIFLVLGFMGMQQKIVDAMPASIKQSVGAGIGFFIAFSGLQTAGIVKTDAATLVALGDLGNPIALLGLFSITLTIVLAIMNVKGGVLISMMVVTIVGIFVKNPETGASVTQLPSSIIAFENPVAALSPTFGKLSFMGMFDTPALAQAAIFSIISFLFIDLFNSISVLLGVAIKAGLVDKAGRVPKAGAALLMSSAGAAVGAIFGTNSITIYGAESTTGISQGAKTGLTAVFIGFLFIVCLFFSPVFLMIPSVASVGALFYVGILMISSLCHMDLDDITVAVPVFTCIATMAFTFNIAYGILFGILAYTLSILAAKRAKEISLTMWIITVVCIVYLILDILF